MGPKDGGPPPPVPPPWPSRPTAAVESERARPPFGVKIAHGWNIRGPREAAQPGREAKDR